MFNDSRVHGLMLGINSNLDNGQFEVCKHTYSSKQLVCWVAGQGDAGAVVESF
jgi:hypothetical protein